MQMARWLSDAFWQMLLPQENPDGRATRQPVTLPQSQSSRNAQEPAIPPWMCELMRGIARFLSDLLSGLFQGFLRLFEAPDPAHPAGTHSRQLTPYYSSQRERFGYISQQEQFNEWRRQPVTFGNSSRLELFDNGWRRQATEHARLRSECFKKAREARKRKPRDNAAVNKYVNEVGGHYRFSSWIYFDHMHIGRGAWYQNDPGKWESCVVYHGT